MAKRPRRLRVEDLDVIRIEELAEVIKSGEVAVLPTDTIYGFHALADDGDALDRIFAIKGRETTKPLPVLFSSIQQLADLGADLDHARSCLESIWPAPLTAVLRLKKPLAATVGQLTVAARIPASEWLRHLLSMTGPLASTSLNRSGDPPAASLENLPPDSLDDVAIVVDGGVLDGQPSTVVEFTETLPRVIRQGAFVFTQNLWKTL